MTEIMKKTVTWIRLHPFITATALNFFGTFLAFRLFNERLELILSPLAVALAFNFAASFLTAKSPKLVLGFVGVFVGTIWQLFVTACVLLPLSFFNMDADFLKLGARISPEDESKFIDRKFSNYGVKLDQGIEILHVSYFRVADDMYSDAFLRVKNDNIENVLPDNLTLKVLSNISENLQHKVDDGVYVLCEENTGAKLTDEKLISIICDEEKLKSEMRIGFVNESNDPYLVVRYFPSRDLLWLHEVNY